METQLLKLSNAHTWSLVPLPPEKRAIQCKWVFNYKEGAKATVAMANTTTTTPDIMENARLVTRGDLQSKGVDYMETFTSVIKLVSL